MLQPLALLLFTSITGTFKQDVYSEQKREIQVDMAQEVPNMRMGPFVSILNTTQQDDSLLVCSPSVRFRMPYLALLSLEYHRLADDFIRTFIFLDSAFLFLPLHLHGLSLTSVGLFDFL